MGNLNLNGTTILLIILIKKITETLSDTFNSSVIIENYNKVNIDENDILIVNNNNYNENDDNNDYNEIMNERIGIFIFTKYCGPGNRTVRTFQQRHNHRRNKQEILFNNYIDNIINSDILKYQKIDICCKQHDECPNYIENVKEDYKKFPSLPITFQIFTKLQCKCDGDFYKCLDNLNSTYASYIALSYGIFQNSCFELEHPIIKCNKSVFGRCEQYNVDYTQSKIWQWFDIPLAISKIYKFPKIEYNIQNKLCL